MSVKKSPMTDKQIRIICSAIDIFSEKGYASTSTSRIAKLAGVAEGTIFHYYKTKKDLLLAIPDYLISSPFSQTFIGDIINILENPDENFEDFLRRIINNRSNFAAENLKLIRVLFQEVPFHKDLRYKIWQNILSPNINKLFKAIEYYKEKGQIKDIPNITAVKLIFTSIFGHIVLTNIVTLNMLFDNQKETEYLVQFIISGIENNCRGVVSAPV